MKLDFLKQFIKQTKTDILKTKDYPKEFLDLKMKVSFGQGALARVPWVALRPPDMPQLLMGIIPFIYFSSFLWNK